MILRRSGTDSSTRSVIVIKPKPNSGRVSGHNNCRVSHVIADIGQLHEHAKLRRPLGKSLQQLLGQEIHRLLRGLLGGQEFRAGFGAELW